MYQELKEVWQEFTGPEGPFETHRVDVNGISVKAYKAAPPSLREIWLGSAAHGDKDYLVYQDERWTYTQAHQEVNAVAGWLAEQGVEPGDRVAIAMRNFPEWMLAYWATVSMGATVVGMNAWWLGPEMVYGMEDSDPKVLIADEERLERFLPHRNTSPDCKLVGVRVEGELAEGVTSWSELRNHGGSLPDLSVDSDSDACIFYTSGTTGRPKGAQLTHRGCVNNIFSLAFANMAFPAAAQRARAAAGVEQPPASTEAPPQLSLLVVTPLFHVTANNCVAQSATVAGGKLVHMYKWEPGEALKTIEAERVTTLSGVPVMARELISHPDFDKYDTSSLKSLGGGGAQLQPDLVKKIDEQVQTARPGTGYGMTETCGIITSNSADFFIDKPASAGPAMPVFETRLVDADGNDAAPGEVGELWVKSAQVIRGYLNRPEATAEDITEGWLHTGDIARIDEDGFIFIVDRAKDMVLRGGENVYCAEVESALFDHEDVLECTVFAVPDDRLGEEVGAAVMLKKEATTQAEDLRAFCSNLIAKHKVPRYIWLLDEPLPRNASGKFLKRQLREELDVAEAQ
ncbi:MAG: class I adenylate-forming enzyme family protein [Myxococcota bacterium]|nr:class I adenylate-forming enzyme family protein [Myxococcota bacterium]